MRRRRLLALTGSIIPVALAGCIETSTNENEPSEPSDDDTDSEEDHGGADDSEQRTAEGDEGNDEWTEPDWPTGPYADYETTVVEVKNDDEERLGKVKAAVAETSDQWTLGLSDAESMPENGAMLFLSDSSGDLTFWMKDMSFGLDMVYVGSNREITSIHHAPEPEDGDSGREEEYRFSGTGQYVLEVNYNWTTERGITEGDRLEFELDE